MIPKRFNIIHIIKREEFYRLKALDDFNGRIEYNKIRKQLFIQSINKVEYYKNKNFISKWWNNYYELKDLTTNYTYLDIDLKFYEDPKDSFTRAFSNVIINNMRRDGII